MLAGTEAHAHKTKERQKNKFQLKDSTMLGSGDTDNPLCHSDVEEVVVSQVVVDNIYFDDSDLSVSVTPVMTSKQSVLETLIHV
jgi:hypothetical protein